MVVSLQKEGALRRGPDHTPGPHPDRVVWPTPIYVHFPFENMNRNPTTSLRNENEKKSNEPMKRDLYNPSSIPRSGKRRITKKLGSLWKRMFVPAQNLFHNKEKIASQHNDNGKEVMVMSEVCSIHLALSQKWTSAEIGEPTSRRRA